MAFVRAARKSEVAPGTICEFQVAGKPVAVANVAGKFCALSSICAHQAGPLGEGELEGNVVTCPLARLAVRRHHRQSRRQPVARRRYLSGRSARRRNLRGCGLVGTPIPISQSGNSPEFVRFEGKFPHISITSVYSSARHFFRG